MMSSTILRSVARKACSGAFIRPVCSISSLSRGFLSESGPERKVAFLGGSERKVAFLGAAGGIGQPLSLLMKLNPLHDIAGTPGVAADVSHTNTRSQALVNMISNPVNSTVRIAAEIFKKAGTYDEKRLFGVTTLDVVRAKTFYAGEAKVNVAEVNAPVVGGHADITILPLFSQATPFANLADEDIKAVTKRTQDGGTEVVEAKAGKGSATLSISYAGAIFADACLKGLYGVPDVVECSYVQSTITAVPFFAAANLALFWHINEGIKEIMADYVHHELTRNMILVSLRLFLLIVTKDILLSLVS